MKKIVCIFLLGTIFIGCDKGSEVDNTSLPQVTTGTSSDITMTSARISATLVAIGEPGPAEYGIVWSVNPAPTTAHYKLKVGTTSTPLSYQADLITLVKNQVYYVRAYAINGKGVQYGQEISFTTLNRTTCDISSLTGSLANGVVLYLPFCGDATDKSVSANHGTVSGASLTADRLGNPNSAYQFNGMDNRIVVPDHPSLNSGTLSISLWYKTSNFTSPQRLLYKAKLSDGTAEEYTLVHNLAASGNMMVRYKNASGCQRGVGWQEAMYSNFNADWHHLVFTHDGIVGRLYLDGLLVSTNGMSTGPIDICPGGSLIIGAGLTSEPTYWSGVIDDVIIYNRGLSASEVTAIGM